MLDQRILIVENDPQMRQLLSDVLVTEGYTVDATGEVHGARELLGRQEYGLVIADWQLPTWVVVSAAARLGARTTVMSDFQFRMRRDRSDGHDTMIRPIRPSELLAAVERHIGKPAQASCDS
jgi:two-component system OmpR family response regulator